MISSISFGWNNDLSWSFTEILFLSIPVADFPYFQAEIGNILNPLILKISILDFLGHFISKVLIFLNLKWAQSYPDSVWFYFCDNWKSGKMKRKSGKNGRFLGKMREILKISDDFFSKAHMFSEDLLSDCESSNLILGHP